MMEETINQEFDNSMDMSCNGAGSEELFADISPSTSNLNHSSGNMELEEECTWRGTPLSELRRNTGMFMRPAMRPGRQHTVLIELPIVKGQQFKPFPSRATDVWNKDFVRMPHSSHSLYPVTDTELRRRWELVQEALTRPIRSSHELEEAIFSYNTKYSNRWNFDGLHAFFSETLEEEETQHFFSNVLPEIIQLALALPDLITDGIPMLQRKKTHSITLSQRQISSLLANAFLCTFPRRNTRKRDSEYGTYPDINFNRLYHGYNNSSQTQEKLKCLINYFRRVCTKVPEGVVSFSRVYVPTNEIPDWKKETGYLPRLHVCCKGTIENEGRGMLQIDFANKYVGGGVLGQGCVQEEIRFIICPELIVSRLFTECLDHTEALVVTGVERYNNHEGYADNFQWAGDYQDTTPRDNYGRCYCTLVAMDAVHFHRADVQYLHTFIDRELNKAYSGFFWAPRSTQCKSGEGGYNTSVATGNWGCGAFRGDAKLKALLQMMAASKTGRDMAYFTFNDLELRNKLIDLHTFLTEKKVTIGQLYNLICCYGDVARFMDLYSYLFKAVGRTTENGEPSKKDSTIHSLQPAIQTSTAKQDDSWFLSSQELEAALEGVDDSDGKIQAQKSDTKYKMERKSYSVSSDLCVQRQSESWVSLEECKKDFSECKSGNKIESDVSPQQQRTAPLKRKISDYFSSTKS